MLFTDFDRKMWTLVVVLVFASVAQGKYQIVTQEANFGQAFAYCKRTGYSLATEKSLQDTDSLNAAVVQAGLASQYFYIGGFHQSDNVAVPEWIWIETGKEITYDNWSSGASKDGECLVRTSVSSATGNWISSSCTSTRYFICEGD